MEYTDGNCKYKIEKIGGGTQERTNPSKHKHRLCAIMHCI